MKKIILSLMLVFALSTVGSAFENVVVEDVSQIQQSAKEQSIAQPEVVFDWIDISKEERQAQADKYKNILFNQDLSKLNLTKQEFLSKFKNYKKDYEYKHHYMLTNEGVREDEDAKYCAFYYKKGTLVMYAIQYKKNPHNSFYYSAYGKLYYVDLTSDAYPNFPYYSVQYNRKGVVKSAIYFVSKDLQYMYGTDKEFQGLWYKDKMYDINGNQKSTRTNW